jgi:hypothetical protein
LFNINAPGFPERERMRFTRQEERAFSYAAACFAPVVPFARGVGAHEHFVHLFVARRQVQPNDTIKLCPFGFRDTWSRLFLSPEQLQEKPDYQRRVFNVFMHRELGGKWFVIALLEHGFWWLIDEVSGSTMTSSRDVLEDMAAWLVKVVAGIKEHEGSADVVHARKNSGSFGVSPLTDQARLAKQAIKYDRRNAKRAAFKAKQVLKSKRLKACPRRKCAQPPDDTALIFVTGTVDEARLENRRKRFGMTEPCTPLTPGASKKRPREGMQPRPPSPAAVAPKTKPRAKRCGRTVGSGVIPAWSGVIRAWPRR